MSERAERMMSMLRDEWDCVVVLASRYSEETGTEQLRYVVGNAFANEKMLESMLDEMQYSIGIGYRRNEDNGYEEEDEG